MKDKIINIMATTGATLVILSVIASLHGAKLLCVSSIFQSFGANIVIHIGFILTSKFESQYPIIESVLDISYAITILVIFGIYFKWFTSTPIWVLIIMAIVIYLFGYFIRIFRIREDIKSINKLLERRNRI